MESEREAKRLHERVSFVGLRAQATAVGFLQLVLELRRAGVIEDAAVERIKGAIATNIGLARPRSRQKREYEDMIRQRLDILFARPAESVDAAAMLGTMDEGREAYGFSEED